ncbi:Domain of unknown function [Micromonospora rhizosphaerae]|uniref:Transcriptional regulator, AbiEi antitoxin, Type IV TA system n=1 Tax=Micromonospora rhizosphaerae TaxID=568872 RepID=A0A1C6RBW9_9ACTN|nr:hypothetical protein [Micromonospora rhizosphaerae]SCL14500.1 Domain of unknown function [Micromonospora rhizosphaerae]
MPPVAHRPSALAWQVFRGSDAVRRGLLTPHQLRSSVWVRLRHDVYADARLERDHGLACRAVALRMPLGAVIAGPSAAYLHGVEHAADFRDDVHVIAPPATGLRSQRGLRVHTTLLRQPSDVAAPGQSGAQLGRGPVPSLLRVPPGGIRTEDGLPFGVPSSSLVPTSPGHLPAEDGPALGAHSASLVPTSPGHLPAEDGPALGAHSASLVPTPPGRVPAENGLKLRPAGTPRSDPTVAAWETAAWLEPVRAVGIVDALLTRGLTTREALGTIATHNGARPGGKRARWVFGLVDPGAQSPPESHLRVRLVLAGLPRPVPQHPVRLPSGLVLHPDLAWPEFRVAAEYDGQWHADRDQLHRDRQRLNQLVAAGWLVLHVTSRRLHQDFAAVVREVRSALASRGWRG